MPSPGCLFDQVRHFAQQRAGRAALVTRSEKGMRQLSYAELDKRAKRVCNGLLGLNLDRQSRVAILCGNRNEFFEIWQGASLAGHVLTPINTRLAAREIAFILNDSTTRVLFVDAAFKQTVQDINAELDHLKHVFVLGGKAGQAGAGLPYSEWRERQSPTEPSPAPHADDTVVQMHTSGTTGFPKGVELGHGSVLACVRSMMGRAAWPAGEVTLVTAPLFHTAGSAYAHCALQSGGTVILLESLSPAAVLAAIEQHGVNQALLVPALIRMVLESPGCADTDFSSLRRILYGASPIPVSILQKAIKTFACDFAQGYGLTESVGPVAMLYSPEHARGSKLKSCGRAVPGTHIKVVDADGNECATGEVGEIIVSGSQLMKAYWNRPAETADVMRAGWLHTGDAGYFDADGYLYIHDRLKDMIVSGGENVYPAEVESVMAACSGIADVAVIGVPDERWGEAVKALVVPQPGSKIKARDIAEYTHQRIAGFKCPKSIDFVDSIPRNPSGKILKKILREPYWAGHERSVS